LQKKKPSVLDNFKGMPQNVAWRSSCLILQCVRLQHSGKSNVVAFMLTVALDNAFQY